MKKRIKRFKEKRAEKKAVKELAPLEPIAVPRITNETVAAHREEVLTGGRKYIYPLRHSKHQIVIITTTILIIAILGFITYCVLSLYKFQTSSSFMYRVTQVVPFPIARTGKTFVSYEDYLFELRHYIHYYENQQKLSFESESGQQQLANYKKRAIATVINAPYIEKVAKEKNITVSDQEIDQQIEIAREQNRLGGSERVLEDVLKEYWGWSLDDFKRSLRAEILKQKVASALDPEANKKAQDILAQIRNGGDFAELAKQHSDDEPTKPNGGDFGTIDKTNRSVSPQTVNALFTLKPGEVSEPVIISYEGGGYALQLVKNIEAKDGKAHGAHIIIKLKDIEAYLNDEKEKQPVRVYMNPS